MLMFVEFVVVEVVVAKKRSGQKAKAREWIVNLLEESFTFCYIE